MGDPPISGIAEPLNQRIADLAREILGEPGAISLGEIQSTAPKRSSIG
ncbi:MAG: hypothetical protein ACXW3T_14200 [Rhodoplanes sp.]